MSFEEWQGVWRTGGGARPARAEVDALVRRVRAEAGRLDRVVLRRDVMESAAALLVSGIFALMAWSARSEGVLSWPLWSATLPPLGVMAFLLAARRQERRRRPASDDSLRTELHQALAALDHQIWLLERVRLWYLAPLGLSGGLVGLQVLLAVPLPATARVTLAAVCLLVVGLVLVVIDALNRRVVERQLHPRRARLEADLAFLETAGEAGPPQSSSR